MNRDRLRILAVILVSSLAAVSSVAAQPTEFSTVFTRVRTGDTLSVIDANGHEFTGKVTDASAAALSLDINGAIREFREPATRRIVRRDSARNGALIGFGVGAVPGIVLGSMFTTYCTNEATSCPTAPIYGGVLTGLLGALAGYEIDRHMNTTLFKSSGQSATVRLVPIVASERRGVSVSFGF